MPMIPVVIPVVILGAGRMGRRIAMMLGQDSRFAPTIAARDPEALALAAADGHATAALADPQFREDLRRLLSNARAVILTDATAAAADVASLAVATGCHYLDIAESAASGSAVARVARDLPAASRLCLAPGCGLAPGYVTALAADAASHAGADAEITVFVGVLPATPTNRLGYANIWGIDGLIAEYTNPCLAVREGELISLPALSEPEQISHGGARYEAFTTAGSLDTLAQSLSRKVRGLVFKTLRHPGHLDYMRFLLDDMGLSKRIYQLRSLLNTALPRSEEDRVLIAIRTRAAPQAKETWTWVQRLSEKSGEQCRSAIGTITAAHVCAVTDLVCTGRLDRAGLLAPGEVGPAHLRLSPFFDFLAPVKPAGGED